MKPERLESLDLIESACWRELARATHDRHHPWRVVVLATVDGGRADARSVILRDTAPDRRELIFYTDGRSGKVAQIRSQPEGMLVAWHPGHGWQLRASVRLRVEDSGLDVSSRWARVKMSPSANDYLAALPPGTPVDRYQPERGSREHFAVVTGEVQAMDWLELHRDGHRRARLAGSDSQWLTP